MKAGDRVGDFTLEEFLGAGGAAEVFRAVGPDGDEPVVLKFLQEGAGTEVVRRFHREIRVLEELDHPNLVRVLDSGELDGRHYYVMPFLDVVALDRLLRPGGEEGATRPGSRALLAIADQVLAALEEAHAHGVLHRDIKPANILVGAGDRAYLADFGIALDQDATALTGTGGGVGTFSYLAPEQVRTRVPDARTDLYQVGLLLHEVLTGSLPFPDLPAHMAVMRRVEKAPDDPVLLNEHLPRELAEVILRALAPAPEKRYPGAAEFRADLAAVTQREFELPWVTRARETTAVRGLAEPRSQATWIPTRPLLGLALAGLVGFGLQAALAPSPEVVRARELRDAGDLEGATARYRLALDADPGDRTAREELLRVLLERDLPGDAADALGLPVHLAASRGGVLEEVARAWAHHQVLAGEASAARRVAGALPLAGPRATVTRALRAEVALAEDRPADAFAALGDVPPDATALAFLELRAREATGDLEGTRRGARVLAASLAADPDREIPDPIRGTHPPARRWRARVLDLRARVEEAAGDLAAALGAAREAVAADPTGPRWRRVAALHDRRGEPVAMFEASEEAWRVAPDSTAAARDFFLNAMALARHVDANLAFRLMRARGMTRLMEDVRAYSSYLDAYGKGRSQERARVLAVVERFVATRPRWTAAIHLAAGLLGDRDLPGAEARLRELHRAHPGYVMGEAALANVLEKQGKVAEAHATWRRALARAPELSKARRELARSLIRTGDLAGGIAELEATRARDPHDYEAYVDLGDAYARAGRVGEALRTYRALVDFRVPAPAATASLGTDADRLASRKEYAAILRGLYARQRPRAIQAMRELHAPRRTR